MLRNSNADSGLLGKIDENLSEEEVLIARMISNRKYWITLASKAHVLSRADEPNCLQIMNSADVSKNMKSLQDNYRLLIYQVAERLGVSESRVNEIERSVYENS